MSAIAGALDSEDFFSIQKVDVSCGLCGWKDCRDAGWIGARRDMSCPMCRSTIVLNTGSLRARISLLRRLASQLQPQLAGMTLDTASSSRVAAGRRTAPAPAGTVRGFKRTSSVSAGAAPP